MADEEAREEQAGELEAVEAIFGEDFKLLEAADEVTGTGARFLVNVSADTMDGADEHSTSAARVRLEFTHTKTYPKEPVSVLVNILSGLTALDRKQLQTVVDSVAADSIDMVSVFPICDAARDWLCDHSSGPASSSGAGLTSGAGLGPESESRFETIDITTTDKVEVISSKAVGTPVTKETFEQWRTEFLAEMKDTKDAAQREDTQKMTGREYFESKIVVVSAESESFWEAEAGMA